MNYFIFIAALINLVALIGHFSIGRNEYLKPVLDSDIDLVPKKVMQSVFHYMSVFLVLSAFILLAGSHELCPMYDYVHRMIRFIGMAYALFAISQFIIALRSGIPGAVSVPCRTQGSGIPGTFNQDPWGLPSATPCFPTVYLP